jgi:hypothetical protein
MSEFEGQVSRRSLLSKTGAAAVAAVAAGTLLGSPRQAKAHNATNNIDANVVNAHRINVEPHGISTAVFAATNGDPSTIVGSNTGFGYGVEGLSSSGAGVSGIGLGEHEAGVKGVGYTGVWGYTNKRDYSGVYGEHQGASGNGTTGIGRGAFGAGTFGQNGQGYGGGSREARRS